MAELITLRAEPRDGTGTGAALGTLALVLLIRLLMRIRRAHFPWDANCLALVGLPLFSYLLLRSTTAYQKGSVSWKGRLYAEGRGFPPAEEARAGRVHDSRQDGGATRRRAPSS